MADTNRGNGEATYRITVLTCPRGCRCGKPIERYVYDTGRTGGDADVMIEQDHLRDREPKVERESPTTKSKKGKQ